MDGRGAAAVRPRRASHDGGGEVEGGGSPVHFSESRFLQRLLCQARQGSGLGDPAGGECHDRALASLEAMGFDREVGQVALHVSRGREDQALQLCMAGLSFVGASGEGALCDRAPPAPLRCYVCGLGHLSRSSLDCHLRSCRRRFEQREARRPAGERRALLGEEELAPGAQTIEEHYLRLAWPEPAGSGGGARPSGSAGGAGRAASAGAAAGPQRAPVQLLPCEFCARTFLPGRLEAHQKACVQRPRHAAPAPSPAARASAPAAPAAVRAFRSFCEQLERCPGCQRQFRPEVLRSHRERCPPCQRPPGARPSQLVRSTGRRHTQPVPAAAPRASFTPPARGAPAPKASTPDAEVCTSEALLAKGLLLAAGEEDAAALRAELELSLPGAEFVSAFQVAGPAVSSGVYEALRASMQDCGGGGPPAERELWHGTAWAAVPKILRGGYNRSFAGRHGTLLGVATYFSTDLAYSQRFCDRAGGANGTKAAFLSRVLVGRHCKGHVSDVEPPVRDAESGQRFDSTVDNEDQPRIFAVFRDFQALPLFLVEFRT